MEQETVLRLASRVPAVILGVACVLLLVAVILLYLQGRATLLGSGIGLGICYYMANWTRNAWPRPATEAS